MTTLITLLIIFGIFFVLNRFMFDGEPSTVFVGRVTLIFLVLLSGGFYINTALKITTSTPEATEMQRNLLYFFGLFQALIAIGLIFVKSLKIASVVLIASLLTLISLNLFGVLTEYNFLGEKNSNEQLLSKIIGYIVLIIWTALFGLYFKSGDGLVGWRDVEK